MKSIHFILACFLLPIFVACKPSRPSGVISERKLERVLYDFHIAQGMVEHVPRSGDQDYESMRYELQQAVFRKHDISQEDFDRSMVYYLSDMEKMSVIYNHIAERLEREADALGVAAGPRDMYAMLTQHGDTANVWSDRPLFAIRNRQIHNFQMWRLVCDSTWLPGDDILWRFELKQLALQSYGHSELFADIVVVFDNDSVRSHLTSIDTKQDVELRIDNSEDWLPRSISGHLFATPTTDPQQERIFIAYSPSLIRFHKHKTVDVDTNSLFFDSLSEDSISRISTDSVTNRRLSPEEFRNLQPVDRTIDVVKERPYVAPRKNNKKRFVQPRRQKK